jgi:hypothetical protein
MLVEALLFVLLAPAFFVLGSLLVAAALVVVGLAD